MPIKIVLSPLQLKQIASAIPIKDIVDYIENHQDEYEQFLLLEEEKNKKQANKTNKFNKFAFLEGINNNLKIQNKFKIDSCVVWKEYIEKEEGD